MQISRDIRKSIQAKIGANKVILLFGTRRVGKTYLLKGIEQMLKTPYLHLNAEDIDVQQILQNRSIANYKRLIGNHALLVIDEAQVIPDIGKVLKLMIDELPDLTIIATGSSAFDLSNQTGEPLTGRNVTFHLYPVSQGELMAHENTLHTQQNLDERLIYGSYPELFNLHSLDEKSAYLKELVNAYLLKDILAYEGIKSSTKILSLLKLIAFQAGSEVSYDELGKQLGLSKNTVERYLDLLTKVDILFKLTGFSSNLRKEIVKSSKWYFYDNGIRNAIINDFRLPAVRQDMGMLWESYCIYERIKNNWNTNRTAQYYFWRTYDQQEIDLIETERQQVKAFEFKWADKPKRVPAFFAKNYPQASFLVVNRENYLDFVLG